MGANIEVANDLCDKIDNLDHRNTGFNSIWSSLPLLFKKTCNCFDKDDQKFMMLIGNLTAIGSILTNTSGVYDNCSLYPNLYLFVNGRASSGKGKLTWSKALFVEIEGHDTGFIPANNSMEGFMQLLNRNSGKGLMFETEGDTLSNILKKEYGNYSDILRKSFHHESISYYRKTNDVLVEVDSPKLSVILSGTPKQLTTLIPNPENGLFSRFLFLHLESDRSFKDVFAKNKGLSTSELYGTAIDDFNENLNDYYTSKVIFDFSEDQKFRFLKLLRELKIGLVEMVDIDLDSTANRMGCNFFRIAMILTQVRAIEEGNQSDLLICSDTDFKIVELIVEALVEGAIKAFDMMPKQTITDDLPLNKLNLYKQLPLDEFHSSLAVEIGENLSIGKRTIQRFLKESDLFEKIKQGYYQKKTI